MKSFALALTTCEDMKFGNMFREPPPYFELPGTNGSAEGLALLGLCHKYANGVDCDLDEACRLFRDSSRSGKLLGKVQLALCYIDGVGVEEKLRKSISSFARIRETGIK